MPLKKKRNNMVVALLTMAAMSTATAVFYYNNYLTAACCAATASSSSAASAAGEHDRQRAAKYRSFGASRPQPSQRDKGDYTVCEVHGPLDPGYDRDRQLMLTARSTDQTNYTDDSVPTNASARAAVEGTSTSPPALIYFITPTYPRREQIAELTRLGQTLMLVPRIHWIVADDRPDCSQQLTALLPDFGIPYTHVASPMPAVYRRKAAALPRGVSNRRAALDWIRHNHDRADPNAVVYFGDDDNTFHLDLFKEIRTTKKISMFPVGLVGEYGVSSPIIDKGKVVGFFDSWPAKRKFPVDMAGFAVNVQLIFQHPYATMPYQVGFEEDRFLMALGVRLEDIEPKAENCTKILVWHTQTAKKPNPVVMVKSKSTLPGSLATLLDQISILGIGNVSETAGIKSYMTKNGNIYRL
ncbi:galactosylgalactosylxylosylprotein 3-beta-glucuronosyltransferase S-like [Adelges cooleyi]|uniref:galactosylgalactosylxylosylprotein 3-beta-glucuronosyltransferase S-like n=1 Tax=Adelges cooleyi TaxID=133065 RepID=UPI00217F3775|nr:galactosylgalactosylxylosylprotein 3-beta-glucuronosyltransferase S-like [Adelges cooleyi]XP_050426847.1 galactosylgalactosylxylosylprotein 3-beta-glucuronosyltransferase S-like [Adelges cooleyi]